MDRVTLNRSQGDKGELCWKWLVLMGKPCGSRKNSIEGVIFGICNCLCGCFMAECAQLGPLGAIFGHIGAFEFHDMGDIF